MWTIYQNSNDKGHDFDSFKKNIIKICNDHRNENRALAFAFILYDFENPHLWKILNDREYWLALNQISGKYLTVFSLNYRDEHPHTNHGDFEGGFQMLLNVPIRFNPSKGTNKLISKYFGDLKVKYPAILFFQVNNDTVTDSLLIELQEEEIEASFLELKSIIKSAVDALKDIKKKYKHNINEVFDSLERSVQSTTTIRKLKRVAKNGGNIIGLISSIIGIYSFSKTN